MIKDPALSVGAASHDQNPEASVEEILKIADELMYQDKNDYYKRTGKERRKSTR